MIEQFFNGNNPNEQLTASSRQHEIGNAIVQQYLVSSFIHCSIIL
jgi:hypothetical protein